MKNKRKRREKTVSKKKGGRGKGIFKKAYKKKCIDCGTTCF